MFAILLRERNARQMKQAQLARESGLSPQLISFLINGARSPTYDNVERLAPALGHTFQARIIPTEAAGEAERVAEILSPLGGDELVMIERIARALRQVPDHNLMPVEAAISLIESLATAAAPRELAPARSGRPAPRSGSSGR